MTNVTDKSDNETTANASAAENDVVSNSIYNGPSSKMESFEFSNSPKKPSNNDEDASLSSNFLMRLIQLHYRTNSKQKSESQIQREKYLIPFISIIPFNRWFLMPSAVLIQFCCGSLYAWSVYNKPIDNLIYGDVVNMAPITFYIAVGFFGFSAAVMGPWLERQGPFAACTLGTTLFFIGNLLTALALHLKLIWLVFIGYGVIAGFGLGLCYISPVSALQKWFPDKRGLASGFAVCGFGAGSIAIAKAQIPLIANVGLPLTFIILGSIFFIIMIACALVLRTPPPNYMQINSPLNQSTENMLENGEITKELKLSSSSPSITLVNAITSKTYRLMYVMFFANAIFGLVVISRLSNMIQDIFGKTQEEASTIVSVNGGFNLGGRLVFSILSDFIGRKNCYVIMLSCQLIILGIFSTITDNQLYWTFLIIIWILTACYGGGFGVIPAFLTDVFGPTNIGACHGIILTAWSLAGVAGGLIFTAIFDSLAGQIPWNYNINVWWIFAVVVIGWIAILLVEPTEKDKQSLRKICFCWWRNKRQSHINSTS